MQFEIGKKYYGPLSPKGFYKICVGIHDGRPILHTPNSKELDWLHRVFIKEWKEYKEPITVEGWVNVYDPPLDTSRRALFTTQDDAIASAINIVRWESRKLVATVYVKGTSDET